MASSFFFRSRYLQYASENYHGYPFDIPIDHRLFGGNVESNRRDSTYCHALPAERNVRACYCIHNNAALHIYVNAGIEFDLLHDRG